MKFKEGLNVIIGANNAGKTNLLYAINLLKDLNIEIDDFNKNDILKKYMNNYQKEAPIIEVEYEIFHEISEDDENDESIIKLLPFLGLDRINEIRTEQGNKNQYLIVANIKIKYELNKKILCITDKDFKKVCFVRNNIAMVCQNTYGSTFEDELFLANMDNKENAIKLLKIVSSKSLNPFIEENELDFNCWKVNYEKYKKIRKENEEKFENFMEFLRENYRQDLDAISNYYSLR